MYCAVYDDITHVLCRVGVLPTRKGRDAASCRTESHLNTDRTVFCTVSVRTNDNNIGHSIQSFVRAVYGVYTRYKLQ